MQQCIKDQNCTNNFVPLQFSALVCFRPLFNKFEYFVSWMNFYFEIWIFETSSLYVLLRHRNAVSKTRTVVTCTKSNSKSLWACCTIHVYHALYQDIRINQHSYRHVVLNRNHRESVIIIDSFKRYPSMFWRSTFEDYVTDSFLTSSAPNISHSILTRFYSRRGAWSN